MPARFIFTPAAIPPKPAPTTITRAVPAGPNNSCADGLTRPSMQRYGDAHERLQPHRDRRDGPRALEAVLSRRPRLPVLVRDQPTRRRDREAQLAPAAARSHGVVPDPRWIRARVPALLRARGDQAVPRSDHGRARPDAPVDRRRRHLRDRAESRRVRRTDHRGQRPGHGDLHPRSRRPAPRAAANRVPREPAAQALTPARASCPRLSREPEQALADDVALDLARS